MEIKIQKIIGDTKLEASADEKDPRESLINLAIIANAPTKCDLCQSQEIHLDANKSTTENGTFTFVKVVCKKCDARAQLGEYKAGGFFWKKWEKYVPKNTFQEPKKGKKSYEDDEEVIDL